ncbi:MAG: hypothetical protein ABI240_07375 [Sphingomonas sp.]
MNGSAKSATSEPIMGRRELIRHSLSAIIAFILTPILAAFWKPVQAGLLSFDLLISAPTLVLLMTTGIADTYFAIRRKDALYIPLAYMAGLIFFALVAASGTPLAVKEIVAILGSIGWTCLIRLVIARLPAGAAWHPNDHVGVASAGVLIMNPASASRHFVLVHNRNLREGRGLWVPPGGHVDIAAEQPADRLREKIIEEVGVLSSTLALSPSLMPGDPHDIESAACTWMLPPAFLLREDLMGLCSKGHGLHLDLCYICTSDGEIRNHRPKYDARFRIEIPVADCADSFQHAEAAIGAKIDDWYRRYEGKAPGVRSDLTKDVIWRLHLVAAYFERRNSGKDQQG